METQLEIIIIFFSILFSAKISQSKSWISKHDLCKPSSCGNITSIRPPFRLVSYPANCGTAELACENNTTFFYTDSSDKYRVEEIDYNSHEFRVVDAQLIADNYSSLPLNFPPALTKNGHGYFLGPNVVAFLSCDELVNSTIYLNTVDWVKGRYSYILMGGVTVADVADTCTVEKVIPIMPWSKEGVKDARNYSYKDVQNAMAYGFIMKFPSRFGWFFIFYGYCILVLYMVIAKQLCLFPIIFSILIFKCKRMCSDKVDNIETFLQSHTDIMPIRYSYLDIRRITNGFDEKLGEGAYGSVYKGKLKSGRIVAVKLLNMPKSNGQDFINEVSTIGTIHHFNIVRLVGYTAERYKRALVYDYMPNGSLEKYIFPKQGDFSLSCEKMYEISLGVARGIEYLHRGCNMQILHFDIKPHNIC